MTSPRRILRAAGAALLLLFVVSAARADDPATAKPSEDQRIERLEKLLEQTRADLAAARTTPNADAARLAEIERQIGILAAEIEKLKLGEAAAPPVSSSAPVRGVGPAASKVYGSRGGVSIGGYGETLYENIARKDQSGSPSFADDQVTLLRAVTYLGYKFDEHFVLNTEIEFEQAVVASDKDGEAEVEFAYLDYMHSRAFNVRAGLVLIPVGLVNTLHEPTTFLGARRPDVEQVIIPSTWRELGFGFYGEKGPLTYSAYLVNGLNAVGYASDIGIREGSQEGSQAVARNWAFTGRLDYTGTTGLLVGASIFSGRAGQGAITPTGAPVRAQTTVWDAHADFRWRGLWFRGLYAASTIGDADRVNELNGYEGDESVGSRQHGWYLQGAFDLLSLKASSGSTLYPFVRYEQYDTQASVPTGYERNPENDVRELTVGAAYKPIDQIVVKADWQQRRNAARTGVNQFNVAIGYIF